MIRIKNVSVNYVNNGSVSPPVLAKVDVTIPEGQFVCILGPSGCGKTTLLNLIAGFIKPTSGQVLFNGSKVVGPGPERGVVFQDPTLFPWLTVLNNVAFGLRQRGVNKAQRFETAMRFIDLVGMSGHADDYPYTLSGGMRQRIAIARVLALAPKALLMDEPFSSLDANSRERLQDALLRVWQAHRRTLFYVTHSVEEAVYLAERVIVMGAAPENICGDMPIELSRPRDRTSAEFAGATAALRAALDTLPCCIKPSEISDLRQGRKGKLPSCSRY